VFNKGVRTFYINQFGTRCATDVVYPGPPNLDGNRAYITVLHSSSDSKSLHSYGNYAIPGQHVAATALKGHDIFNDKVYLNNYAFLSRVKR
jgi:hypothetical protein